MIQIDTRSNETLIFDTATTGVRDPVTVAYRLFMSLTESFELCLTGKHNDGELVFTIPPLKDLVNVQDKQQVPFHIEALIDDYSQTIIESEMVLLFPPEITIDKMTHVKQEPVKEEKQNIKIEEKIIVKPKSKFAENFSIFVTQGENKE